MPSTAIAYGSIACPVLSWGMEQRVRYCDCVWSSECGTASDSSTKLNSVAASCTCSRRATSSLCAAPPHVGHGASPSTTPPTPRTKPRYASTPMSRTDALGVRRR
eukprot:755123-Rhodomonas_salina.1